MPLTLADTETGYRLATARAAMAREWQSGKKTFPEGGFSAGVAARENVGVITAVSGCGCMRSEAVRWSFVRRLFLPAVHQYSTELGTFFRSRMMTSHGSMLLLVQSSSK